jgi:hypothetical protein
MEAINNMIEIQTKLKQEGKNVQAFIVLDDIVGVVTKDDPFIQRLATSARHANISLFVAVQGLTRLPPVVRDNAEYVFIFRTNNGDVKNKIYETWNGGLIGTKKDFAAFMDKYVENFAVLCINAKTQSNDKSKVFSLFKAPKDKVKFRFEK